MSIERNSQYGVGYTIKTLSDLPIGSRRYNIKQYIHTVNAGWMLPYKNPYEAVILVRCRIPLTARGYILGRRYNNDDTASRNMFIEVREVSGVAKIVWNMKGNEVASVNLDDKVHDIGFVGSYAVMDNKKVNVSQSEYSGVMYDAPITVCGCTQFTSASSYTNSYMSEMYLYRADMQTYSTASPSSTSPAELRRFYPLGDTVLQDAMKYGDDLTYGYGTSGSATAGDNLATPYGVQMDDLKFIFGSGYKDLMCLICSDGGPDARSGQTEAQTASPYQITYNNVTHDFAFDLRNTKYPGGTTPNPSTSLPDRRGHLMRGRRPKWDIWNDSVAHGFYIMNDNGTKTLEYNIFKKADGTTDNQLHLEWFNGYNTEESHPPTLTIANPNATVQFHNGENYRCREASLCVPYRHNYDYYDHGCIFYVENVADMSYNVKLGNAIPWNIPAVSLGQDYGIVGGGVSITIGGDVYASTAGKENTIMCADSPSSASSREELKTKYSVNGLNGALTLNYLVPSLRNMLLSATGNTVEGKAVVSLLNNLNTKILMPELCGEKSITLTGEFNPTLDEEPASEVKNRRQFIAEWLKNGSSQKYMAYCTPNYYSSYGYDFLHWDHSSYQSDPACLVLVGQECNSGATSLIEDSTSTFYAQVSIEVASASHPDTMYDRKTCMIAGLIDINGSQQVSPYSEGTKQHVAWDWARQVAQLGGGSWYKNNYASLYRITSTYTNFFVASAADFGYNDSDFKSIDFDHANIRFDVFRTDVVRSLAVYDGTYMEKPESTAWVHGSLVQNTTPVFVHRLPDELITPSNGLICNTYMRKYKNTNSNPDIGDTSGWQIFNEGPDAGQSAPSFIGTVKVYKKGMTDTSYTQVASFEYTSSDSFGSATGTYPREYTQIQKTDSGYTCSVNFSEQAAPFNSPNGGAETLGNSGYLWYYTCKITGSSIAAGDTFKIIFE